MNSLIRFLAGVAALVFVFGVIALLVVAVLAVFVLGAMLLGL